jgi:hypothetical protein
MNTKTRAVGWMYREDGTPPYIRVKLNESEVVAGDSEIVFADNQLGAQQAADAVTSRLGRDDWTLQDMQFLGYRIRVPVDDEKNSGNPSTSKIEDQEQQGLIHRLTFGKNKKLHGWHLNNVQVDCGAVLKHVSPVSVDEAKDSARLDRCSFCIPTFEGAAQVVREEGTVYVRSSEKG